MKRFFLSISLVLIAAIGIQPAVWTASAAAAATTPADSYWLGEWVLKGSSAHDQSTIKVERVAKGKMTFSLDAYHLTSPANANVGNIDRGTAVVSGSKAVFTDSDLGFKLTMTLQSGLMQVSTTQDAGYFGSGVRVDGTYAKKKPAPTHTVKSDFLIVPGKSVGKIKLGMTKDQVRKLLGKPTQTAGNQLIYKSAKNEVDIFMNSRNVVAQIAFTSSSFATIEGITTKTCENYGKKFNRFEFQWRFLQQRYDWKAGGLSFFTFNADVPDDNPDYSRSVWGYVYAGKKMFDEPITGVTWKAV